MLSLLAGTPPQTTTTIVESGGSAFGWSDFWFAIVTGVAAAMVWWLLAEIIRRVRAAATELQASGWVVYRVTRKLATAPEQETLLISDRPAPSLPRTCAYTARVTFGFA